jgi:hypothetical protein
MHTKQLREWINLFEAVGSNSTPANNDHNDRPNMISLQELMSDETHNQLSEDAKANAELIMVAKYVAKFLFKTPDTTIKFTDIVKSQNKDVITDLALKALLDNLYFYYKAPFLPFQRGKRGSYSNLMGRPLIWANSLIITNEQTLTHVLIHELRHALDDFKSNYSKKWQDKTKIPPLVIHTPEQNNKFLQAYYKLTHEVNARFAQVLLDIADDTNITRSNLKDKISEYLTKHHITVDTLNAENDPKYQKAKDRYKKLYSKAASFWQAYAKNKTQLQTEIGIPEIPKTASANIAKKPGFIQRVKDIAKKAVTSIF